MGIKASVLERVYNRLLREADLGSVQFSPDRTDGVDRGEPNTPFESDLHRELTVWIRQNRYTPGLKEKLRALMGDPQYSGFFREPPPSATLYRGIALRPVELDSLLGGLLDTEETSRSGDIEEKFTIGLHRRADRGMASWTYDPEEARKFAVEAVTLSDGSPIAAVVRARAGDNPGIFIDLHHMESRVRQWSSWAEEAEVAALDVVTASGVSWDTLKL